MTPILSSSTRLSVLICLLPVGQANAEYVVAPEEWKQRPQNHERAKDFCTDSFGYGKKYILEPKVSSTKKETRHNSQSQNSGQTRRKKFGEVKHHLRSGT